MVDEAAAILKTKFNLPIALIEFDTVIAAAGYDEPGADNDAGATQKVMNVLRRLSRHTGALMLPLDHFGKVLDTGTRGSSAKEGGADTVLALLADRELNGALKNTRLAVRKQRDGVSGFEIPFTVRLIERGIDEDGDQILAPVIDWQTTGQPSKNEAQWTPSMRVLRRVLTTMLADIGMDVTPFTDGPTVRACDIEPVRQEFYRQYAATGSEEQKKEARSKAFRRAVHDAAARGLVATREVGGTQLIWLLTP
jgi:hypothetical protein